MLFPLTLYHWYSKRVGLLDQDPRPVLSTEPTLTEEGPGIEGRTEFTGGRIEFTGGAGGGAGELLLFFIIIFILKCNIIFNAT